MEGGGWVGVMVCADAADKDTSLSQPPAHYARVKQNFSLKNWPGITILLPFKFDGFGPGSKVYSGTHPLTND